MRVIHIEEKDLTAGLTHELTLNLRKSGGATCEHCSMALPRTLEETVLLEHLVDGSWSLCIVCEECQRKAISLVGHVPRVAPEAPKDKAGEEVAEKAKQEADQDTPGDKEKVEVEVKWESGKVEKVLVTTKEPEREEHPLPQIEQPSTRVAGEWAPEATAEIPATEGVTAGEGAVEKLSVGGTITEEGPVAETNIQDTVVSSEPSEAPTGAPLLDSIGTDERPAKRQKRQHTASDEDARSTAEGGRNAWCEQCQKNFNRPQDLKRHLVTSKAHKANDTVFECRFCGARFPRGDSKQRHEKSCSRNPEVKEKKAAGKEKTKAKGKAKEKAEVTGNEDAEEVVPGKKTMEEKSRETRERRDERRKAMRERAIERANEKVQKEKGGEQKNRGDRGENKGPNGREEREAGEDAEHPSISVLRYPDNNYDGGESEVDSEEDELDADDEA